jgi:hypothetical protein
MKDFLNSKLVPAIVLAITMLSIGYIMRVNARTPFEMATTIVAALGTVALALTRSLTAPSSKTLGDVMDEQEQKRKDKE